MAIKRVMNRKVQYEGIEFDSREELRYYIILLDNKDVSCIHRQSCAIKTNIHLKNATPGDINEQSLHVQ